MALNSPSAGGAHGSCPTSAGSPQHHRAPQDSEPREKSPCRKPPNPHSSPQGTQPLTEGSGFPRMGGVLQTNRSQRAQGVLQRTKAGAELQSQGCVWTGSSASGGNAVSTTAHSRKRAGGWGLNGNRFSRFSASWNERPPSPFREVSRHRHLADSEAPRLGGAAIKETLM